jgi:hypothetical protein
MICVMDIVKSVLRYCAAALSVMAINVPAASAARTPSIRYTDMTGTDCTDIGLGELRCKGADGWVLDIADEGNIIELFLRRSGSDNTELRLMGRGLGDRAEWRGVHKSGDFKPYAMIVRMRPVEDDSANTSLLFVVKLTGAKACVRAVVDATANRNANILARKAADNQLKLCGEIPEIMGRRSAATDALVR